ncbi:hypothetical protein DEU56DRAFT_757514 [Suillus clintonianus]|uniref:uncharacterized protein n=1 Tax=Suillus clintonianus TaxID=1904413 RepID=UPI001B886B8A|nr:uncharacterized protein DEU56DRAFT_757514 [Suillus clintonianus]KAG2131623.1 hypothetical protein DEU56DRAFT_757514 [Suillus clintonianus]
MASGSCQQCLQDCTAFILSVEGDESDQQCFLNTRHSADQNFYPRATSSNNHHGYPSGSGDQRQPASSLNDPFLVMVELNFLNYCSNYPTMTRTDAGKEQLPASMINLHSTSFNDPYSNLSQPQFNLYDVHTLPYAASTVLHSLSFSPYFQYTAPIFSVDSTCTIPPGSEDVPPLGEAFPPLDELLPLDETPLLGEPLPLSTRQLEPQRGQPSGKRSHGVLTVTKDVSADATPSTTPSEPSCLGPSVYDENNRTHESIFKDAREILIRSAVNETPFLFEKERKTKAHDALVKTASCRSKDFGGQWAAQNVGAFYRLTSVPSADILATSKKIVRAKVERGYNLCLSVWSGDSEPKHQIQAVGDLLVNTSESFTPKFIFGKDAKLGTLHVFENDVILDVVLNTLLELGYIKYVTEFRSIFCTAAAAYIFLN